MSTTELDAAKQVILLFGGTTKTAALCDISKSAVSQWMKNGIPRAQLKYLKALRPDLFPPDPNPKPDPDPALKRRCTDHC